MTAKTHRIFGIILLLLAVVIMVFNLQRTANVGLKSIPPIFVVLGVVHLYRARKLERQQS